MSVLDRFAHAAEHPGKLALALKARGIPILGYPCSYTPEEIIHAAGVHPFRLGGADSPFLRADGHLQAYCCSFARGILEQALGGDLAFLDGALFPHTCDTMQRLSDIWRMNTDFHFFADVVLPLKFDGTSARDYLEDVLRRFRADLEAWTGREISGDSLRRSIDTFNAIRKHLEDIYRLRSENPAVVAGNRLSAIVRGSMVMERNELPRLLSELAGEIADGRHHAPDIEDNTRLILSGSLCDHSGFYSILEESGGVAVGDDLCTGSRYFGGTVDTSGDPLAAIARRYAERTVCPAKHRSTDDRAESLLKTVRDNNARGVVFFLLKFCDPHGFDYPWLKNCLEERGIPAILIEVEDRLPPEGQLRTRLETFVQMI
ncbi:MAG: 2-hydroxyacyl-CoA dehydratase family protein [Syntrophales bacterium]|jgi:bcr-type benzoyl-CoA reductase subunit C|nr:2-hydroxyacyl-CoA dehydratase family protein [Syntrophales bacterium]MCK9527391.1 2-hydroxyacyl-CoA dehydratase family protein [Syntrophales bacterium]MDX9921493.1 2-hydroxyacyl-CoA dehydratase family protein [Syntrophales bacterium]